MCAAARVSSNRTGYDVRMAAGLQFSLPATHAAIAQARGAVEALDALEAYPDTRFALRLLVSELFTNAVEYGSVQDGAVIRLSFAVGETFVRVEVGDGGDGFLPDAIEMPDADAESGRGLAFLDVLAHRWGVERNGETRVWFELDLALPA